MSTVVVRPDLFAAAIRELRGQSESLLRSVEEIVRLSAETGNAAKIAKARKAKAQADRLGKTVKEIQ